jgi:hypothetical protein
MAVTEIELKIIGRKKGEGECSSRPFLVEIMAVGQGIVLPVKEVLVLFVGSHEIIGFIFSDFEPTRGERIPDPVEIEAEIICETFSLKAFGPEAQIEKPQTLRQIHDLLIPVSAIDICKAIAELDISSPSETTPCEFRGLRQRFMDGKKPEDRDGNDEEQPFALKSFHPNAPFLLKEPATEIGPVDLGMTFHT